jgi:ParB-like chromosome segregation protein Spo0J
MKTIKVKTSEIKSNPNNPRIIKDDKFKKLVKSIKEFPKMLEIRPIVVNDNMVVLGGNMRLKACIEAGLKELHIIKASELTEAEQKEFIIKDNVGFGEWNWDNLANEWNSEELGEWGLDVWKANDDVSLDDFFKESGDSEKEQVFKIVLEYTEEEFAQINEALKNHSGTKENIFYKLLGL